MMNPHEIVCMARGVSIGGLPKLPPPEAPKQARPVEARPPQPVTIPMPMVPMLPLIPEQQVLPVTPWLVTENTGTWAPTRLRNWTYSTGTTEEWASGTLQVGGERG